MQFRVQDPDDTVSEEEWYQSLEEPRLGYIWRWFSELSDCREGGWGIGPITWREIEAWAHFMRVEVSTSEAQLLRSIDREYRLYQFYKEHPEKRPQTFTSLVESFTDIAREKNK